MSERKDWSGNKKSVWAALAANNHSDAIRETNDYYATDPHSVEIFLDALKRDFVVIRNKIWECACGEGNISEVLEKNGYQVMSTDLIDRGYGISGVDFLNCMYKEPEVDILTNPPYKYAKEFVEHALEISSKGDYVIMYLKIQFLEGKARKKLFEKYPPKYIYVNSERQICALNNDFESIKSSAICYCWFIWEKGYKGDSIVRWI